VLFESEWEGGVGGVYGSDEEGEGEGVVGKGEGVDVRSIDELDTVRLCSIEDGDGATKCRLLSTQPRGSRSCIKATMKQ
jgi:hypothetical protein